MSGSFLLDTNIVVALFAHDAAALANLASADEVYLPSIVAGELFYGAYNSTQTTQNLARIEALVATSVVLDSNAATARHYGRIKGELRLKGRPIPDNDIWIAALAYQHGLTLVSRDTHFGHIANLTIVTWATPPP